MLEPDNPTSTDEATTASTDPAAAAAPPGPGEPPARKRAPRAAKKAPADAGAVESSADVAAPEKRSAKKAARKATAKKAPAQADPAGSDAAPASEDPAQVAPAKAAKKAAKKPPAKKTPAKKAPAKAAATKAAGGTRKAAAKKAGAPAAADQIEPTAPTAPGVLFVAPRSEPAPRRRRRAGAPAGPPPVTDTAASDTAASEALPADADLSVAADPEELTADPEDLREAAADEATGARRRRRRGRRGRGGAKAGGDASDADGAEPGAEAGGDSSATPHPVEADTDAEDEADQGPDGTEEAAEGAEGGGTRRRRRRRRSGGGGGGEDDPPNTVTHVREPKPKQQKQQKQKKDDDDDGVRGVKGSTRLEARRQRRRDGRDTNRRRPPILTESEFLARREAVDRVMAVRQSGDRTQIAVLEDGVLVEHYVTRASATSYVGNVYLGRVQNVLPSMEAAFVDIGKGRNGVLYAGEVNWDAAGLEGKSRAIENALKSGDAVLVQVTKDPIGHKGARLTSQVSLPGRFLVYVPGGGMTGISRRLPDTERHRLKSILKKIVPEDAGVIVRTAAEGASEEELTRDVERLKSEWAAIQKKAAKPSTAPALVHSEPDLAIRVVRDVFNEDFQKLIVQGADAWATVADYVEGVAPDLRERISRHTSDTDVFHDLRVDEGLAKALDRKVWLPSGGSLVIDRTEAMTVIDVNTGKFVGSGGNLEQTVTRNNLEAAEEIVRQLRLRDVGGIVVIDFIDMVLESNRELVLRRLTECLGRDRTKHQVAEVTSLGLVQMTRKRVGEGLLEAFSETCEVCHGRGVILHAEPVQRGESTEEEDEGGRSGRSTKRKRASRKASEPEEPPVSDEQRQKALFAMSAIHRAAHPDDAEDAESVAERQLDAVEAVLSGSAIDNELLLVDGADGASDAPAAQAQAEPESQPELRADAEPDSERNSERNSEPEPGRQPESIQPEEQAEPEQQAEPEPVARPRRRRAATRPAGPPSAT